MVVWHHSTDNLNMQKPIFSTSHPTSKHNMMLVDQNHSDGFPHPSLSSSSLRDVDYRFFLSLSPPSFLVIPSTFISIFLGVFAAVVLVGISSTLIHAIGIHLVPRTTEDLSKRASFPSSPSTRHDLVELSS